jgi:peptidoglycan hydrolase-like protein with peptidoglycan-binding domain
MYKNEKKHLCTFFTCVLLSVMFVIPLSFGAASTALCTDPTSYEKCFQENPSLQNLLLVGEPSADNFQTLLTTDRLQAAIYLTVKYDATFAATYIEQTDLTVFDASTALVAERYFSEDPDNINTHHTQFSTYMKSQGVSINFIGDLSAYKPDGTVTGDNGQINIREFKDKYGFVVDKDGSILLIPKGQTGQYTFSGTITKNTNGDISMKSGTFNGMTVKDASQIWVGKQGNVIADAKQFGALTFVDSGHVIYNPKEKTYQVKDAVLANYPDFKLTGTMTVDEGYLYDDYYIPSGKKMEIHPNTKDPDKIPLNGLACTVTADGGKSVLLNLNTDDFYTNPADYVIEWISNSKDKWLGATPKDEVTIDPYKVIVAEATPALEGQDSSYHVDLDAGAVYTLQADAGKDNFIPMPSKGYYTKGYQAKDAQELQAIKTIQTIVGANSDGDYGPGTKEAVRAWQQKYNAMYGYTPSSPEYLSPDGSWGQKTTTAYMLALSKGDVYGTTTPTVSMDLGTSRSGGIATMSMDPYGLDMNMGGDVAFNMQGTHYFNDMNDGLGRGVAQATKEDVTIPVHITSYGLDGEPTEFTTEAYDYAVGDTATGQMRTSCPILYGESLGVLDTSTASCAGYVQVYARTKAGWYETYSLYGVYDTNYNSAVGLTGPSWQMEHNIVQRGGEVVDSIYDDPNYEGLTAGDARLTQQKSFDLRETNENDIVFFYFKESDYLDTAAADGKDGRLYTHSGIITGKDAKRYDVTSTTDTNSFVKKNLEITDKYLGWDTIYVNGRETVYTNGQYYYPDASGRARGDPITLASGDQVVIETTTVSDLYHKNKREYSLTQMLSQDDTHDGDLFTVHEFVRPNQNVQEDIPEDVAYVPVKNDADLADYFRDQGLSESEIPGAVAATVANNNLPGGTINPKGDVVVVPAVHPTSYQTHDFATNLAQVTGFTDDTNAVINMVEASSKERAKEYKIPDDQVDDLSEITIYIGLKESVWGSDWVPKGAPKIALEQELASAGIWTDQESYGLLSSRAVIAERNADELVAAGAIPESDYTGLNDFVAEEKTGIKNGQRIIASSYSKYVTSDMPFDERLGIVAASYNIRDDAPETTAIQYKLAQVGYGTTSGADGYYQDGTLGNLEHFATDNGISFDKEKAKQDCSYYNADLSTCSTGYLQSTGLTAALDKKYQTTTGKTPPKAMVPEHNPYVAAVRSYCSQVATVPGRCSVSAS